MSINTVISVALSLSALTSCTGATAIQGSKSVVAPARTQAAPDSKPVTKDEFADVFQTVETAVQRVVHGSTKTPPKVAGGSAPVTTDSIVKEFGRVFDACKGKFKFTPRMMDFDSGVLSIKSGTPSRITLERLIKWGFVGKVSPLATSPSRTLSPPEFGDAVGLYLARLAELTHTPNSEWSPYMNWHKDG